MGLPKSSFQGRKSSVEPVSSNATGAIRVQQQSSLQPVTHIPPGYSNRPVQMQRVNEIAEKI